MKPLISLLLLLIIGCQAPTHETEALLEQPASRFATVDDLIHWMKEPTNDYILVVAHRGYWRSAPENSILAVKNAIDAGIDIVEIDVKKTSDGELVVMHDKSLNRTTTGKGIISEITLDSVKSVFLKNGVGTPTHYRVPTLREVMEFVSGKKVLVNLDKCWEYLPEAFKILQETHTVNQALFKGGESLADLRKKHGALLDSIHYMPMVWPRNYNIYTNNVSEEPITYVDEFMSEFDPIGFEVIYDTEDSPVLSTVHSMNQEGFAVWVNTLWPELCAGHYDELAFEDPDAHWGWVIEHGANIIQTDRPTLLMNYLRQKRLHE